MRLAPAVIVTSPCKGLRDSLIVHSAAALQPEAGARFDWYACTVNASVDDLRDALQLHLGGVAHPLAKGLNGYHHGELIKNAAGDVLATLLHGGNGGLPHAFASGDRAPAFSELVRRLWPDRHRVSRMDAALDFDNGDSTFADLLAFCHSIADGERVDGDIRRRVARVTTDQRGDWHHEIHGRTFYLGSYKSRILVRLYEKGIQLRDEAEKLGRARPDVSDNLVRLEVQVRPVKDAKSLAASCEPADAFGYSEWSRELFRRVMGSELQRVDIQERRLPDHERRMLWMCKQYERAFVQEMSLVGGWEKLGEAIRRRIEMQDTPDSVWDSAGDDMPF